MEHPSTFDTLLELVRQSGRTIEKDDLMKEVWPDAVVEENNLNQNISALRRSLGDSRQESQYIATVPGFGYRFVAGVKRLPLSKVAATMDESPQSSVIVDPRIDQHKDKQIEESNSMAVSSPGREYRCDNRAKSRLFGKSRVFVGVRAVIR